MLELARALPACIAVALATSAPPARPARPAAPRAPPAPAADDATRHGDHYVPYDDNVSPDDTAPPDDNVSPDDTAPPDDDDDAPTDDNNDVPYDDNVPPDDTAPDDIPSADTASSVTSDVITHSNDDVTSTSLLLDQENSTMDLNTDLPTPPAPAPSSAGASASSDIVDHLDDNGTSESPELATTEEQATDTFTPTSRPYQAPPPPRAAFYVDDA